MRMFPYLHKGESPRKDMSGQIHSCPSCGANGKDHGEHVGIIFDCDGDYDSPCFQKYLSEYMKEA